MKNSTSAKRTISIDLPEPTSVNMCSTLTIAGVSLGWDARGEKTAFKKRTKAIANQLLD